MCVCPVIRAPLRARVYTCSVTSSVTIAVLIHVLEGKVVYYLPIEDLCFLLRERERGRDLGMHLTLKSTMLRKTKHICTTYMYIHSSTHVRYIHTCVHVHDHPLYTPAVKSPRTILREQCSKKGDIPVIY